MCGAKFKQRVRSRQGFSLIELVIVVVIIGIIGAIAIPRLSRGSEGAADAALRGNLAVLRGALDHYSAEHKGQYPELGDVELKLLFYTNSNGDDNGAKTTEYMFGPYLRKIPPLPVGPQKGFIGFTETPGTASRGWVYDDSTGQIKANTTTEKDAHGTLYSDY